MSGSPEARGADPNGFREWLKKRTPPRVRQGLRWVQRELPFRVLDLLSDRIDLIAPRHPLPPPRLRRRVAGASSRRFFVRSGREALEDINRVFSLSRDPDRTYAAWLDFGCGCGRVARHLHGLPEVRSVTGVDVDREQIAWCRQHLAGEFEVIPPLPPTSLMSAAFDVAYAGSVFTHLDEGPQLAWLREIHRTLKPGGLLIASTHGPSLVCVRTDLGAEQRDRLQTTGFLFAGGQGGFNEDTAFHSREYLLSSWGTLFGLRRYESSGLNRFQDLHVWCKW